MVGRGKNKVGRWNKHRNGTKETKEEGGKNKGMADTDRERRCKSLRSLVMDESQSTGRPIRHLAAHKRSKQPPCRAQNLPTLSPVCACAPHMSNYRETGKHRNATTLGENQRTIISLSFIVSSRPQWAPHINCPWTDLSFLSKHMTLNSWPHESSSNSHVLRLKLKQRDFQTCSSAAFVISWTPFLPPPCYFFDSRLNQTVCKADLMRATQRRQLHISACWQTTSTPDSKPLHTVLILEALTTNTIIPAKWRISSFERSQSVKNHNMKVDDFSMNAASRDNTKVIPCIAFYFMFQWVSDSQCCHQSANVNKHKPTNLILSYSTLG